MHVAVGAVHVPDAERNREPTRLDGFATYPAQLVLMLAACAPEATASAVTALTTTASAVILIGMGCAPRLTPCIVHDVR